MKLLFDQNISHRIIHKLKSIFPGCTQVRLEGLENATDTNIWNYAKKYGFSIVTFDADFYDLATLNGPTKSDLAQNR
jgi:predicted nuclease of predicted toxin-antitoxin system